MINTPITACVITLNEERSIGACIDSLRICDEIIVVDAHSTDRTREIAQARGARVVERDWSGFRTQKQFAVSLARNDWIISVDADERVSPELSSEIVRVRLYGLDEYAGYQIPLLASCFDHPMRHENWNPDYRLRLFNRRRTSFSGDEIRGRVIPYGPVGRLRGNILHDSCRDLDHHLIEFGPYAGPLAGAPHERGRRAGALGMFLNPAWHLLRACILRRGYRNGWRSSE